MRKGILCTVILIFLNLFNNGVNRSLISDEFFFGKEPSQMVTLLQQLVSFTNYYVGSKNYSKGSVKFSISGNGKYDKTVTFVPV